MEILENRIRRRLNDAGCDGKRAFIERKSRISIRVLFRYAESSYWDILATSSEYHTTQEIEESLYDDFSRQLEGILMQLLPTYARRSIFAQIEAERDRQDEKFCEQNHDPAKWSVILMEEVGEVARAVLQQDTDSYIKELVQVAAVAVAAIESHHRRPRELTVDQAFFDDGRFC